MLGGWQKAKSWLGEGGRGADEVVQQYIYGLGFW